MGKWLVEIHNEDSPYKSELMFRLRYCTHSDVRGDCEYEDCPLKLKQ